MAIPEVLIPQERPLPANLALIGEQVSTYFTVGSLPKLMIIELLRNLSDEQVLIDRLVRGVSERNWIEPERRRSQGIILHYDLDQFLILAEILDIARELGFDSESREISWVQIKPKLLESLVGTRLYQKIRIDSRDHTGIGDISVDGPGKPDYEISETQPFYKLPFSVTDIFRGNKDIGIRELSDARNMIKGLIGEGKISSNDKLYPGIFAEFLSLEIEADMVFLIGAALRKKTPVCYRDCTVSEFMSVVKGSIKNMEKRAIDVQRFRRRNEIRFSELMMEAERQF